MARASQPCLRRNRLPGAHAVLSLSGARARHCHQAWVRLGGEPFDISIYDKDTVSEANLARQVFCEADVGSNKAAVLAQRAAAFYGIEVTAYDQRWDGGHSSLIVGCVDNIPTRKAMKKRSKDAYWLDLGNSLDSGQVVLGGRGLPTVFDVLPQLGTMRDRKSLPSCSMAEALARQDLFINSTLATLGGHLLWRLMRQGGLNHHGYFVNLNSGRVSPIEIK